MVSLNVACVRFRYRRGWVGVVGVDNLHGNVEHEFSSGDFYGSSKGAGV